jgi:hypothetical protein
MLATNKHSSLLWLSIDYYKKILILQKCKDNPDTPQRPLLLKIMIHVTTIVNTVLTTIVNTIVNTIVIILVNPTRLIKL